MRIVNMRHIAIIGACLAAVPAFSGESSASVKVLHEFGHCDPNTGLCDGTNPRVGLTGDGAGNFYGITTSGGANGYGVIFKLSQSLKGGYKYKQLYSINCTGSCPDGSPVSGELVVDTNGNLYGAMESGGAGGTLAGTIFRLSPSGKYKVLYNFCSFENCTDGGNPTTPLTYVGENQGALYDGTSPLYGGGSVGGQWSAGADFFFTPDTGLHTLDSFCHYTDTDHCSTGRGPTGALAVDANDTIYGGNAKGAGEGNYGLLWKSSNGITVMYDFCRKDPPTCKAGANPVGVFLDPGSPLLYGTTILGGGGNAGVAFAFDTSGLKYSILHSFCNSGTPTCKDGSGPSSAVYPDHAGGMIGVTSQGGAYGGGALYRMDLATGAFSTLYSFCKKLSCSDGASPQGRVVAYGGSIFGVTYGGGDSQNATGVIWQYTP